MDTSSKDLQLTNSILNFLRAGYLGKLVFHSVMSQLGSQVVDDEYGQATTRCLDKIDPWLKDLSEALPIFATAWKAPETFEAIKAMSFLDELKKDLEWLVTQIEKALKLKDISKEHEGIRFLVGGLARTANTRAFYLDGLGSFLTKFSPEEDLTYIKIQFNDAQEYVRMTHAVFDSFRDMSVVSPTLAVQLQKESSLLVGDFKAQLHDLALLKNVYGGEFTFEKAGMKPEIAALWEAERFSAATAGYWYAYSFTPQEAIAWSQKEIFSPSMAANWKRAEFTPDQAEPWIQAGITPVLSAIWRDAGKDATYAATMIGRGIFDPSQASKIDGRRAAADAELDRMQSEEEPQAEQDDIVTTEAA